MDDPIRPLTAAELADLRDWPAALRRTGFMASAADIVERLIVTAQERDDARAAAENWCLAAMVGLEVYEASKGERPDYVGKAAQELTALRRVRDAAWAEVDRHRHSRGECALCDVRADIEALAAVPSP